MHNNINMSSVSANKPSADLQTDTVRWQQAVNEVVFFFSQCDVAFWLMTADMSRNPILCIPPNQC